MESILYFLVLGALFFFMMRFGCGSHIGGHGGHGGGHAGHGGPAEQLPGGSRTSKDPVCGMDIERDKAYAMVRSEGRELYFCSEDCQKKFIENPKKYL